MANRVLRSPVVGLVVACFAVTAVMCRSSKVDEKPPMASGGGNGGDSLTTGGAGGTDGLGGASNGGGTVAGVGGTPGTAGAGGMPSSVGGDGGDGGDGGEPVLLPKDYWLYVGGLVSGIQGWKFDAMSGAVTDGPGVGYADGIIPPPPPVPPPVPLPYVEPTFRPMYLAARPDGRNLYASDQAPLGRLAALSITPGTGVLVALSQVPSGGAQSVHTAVHPGGNWVFVANYDLPGNLKVFPLLPNGALGTPTDDEITGPGAHQCAISPDGKHVYLPTRSLAYIAQYSFDDQTGQLTPLVPATVAAEDPRHLAFNRDGTRAYLVNEMQIPLLDAGVPLAGSETRATNVAVYSVANGNLTEIQKVVLDPDERGGGAIRVSPDGKFLYVSGRFSQTIYSLAIDPVDGKLAPAGEFNGDGLIDTPRDFIIDPLGNHLLVASADLSQLVILKIDKATGQLATTGAPIPAPRYTGAVLLVPQTAP